MAYTTEELGRLIARAHYQAWRLDAPPFDLTPEELAAILPNLIKSGSAGIVWHRVKPFRERYGAMAYALEAATNAQIAHNQRVEEAVVDCVTRLRAYGIEPVLVKGLAVAKLYPEGIVRPAGDIDLVVQSDDYATTKEILTSSNQSRLQVGVDLKRPGSWRESPGGNYWSRTIALKIDNVSVHVLASPDCLEMLIRHYIGHFAYRPIWAVDIALLCDQVDFNLPSCRMRLDDPDFWRSFGMPMLAAIEASVGSSGSGVAPQLKWMTSEMLRQWVTGDGIFPEWKTDRKALGTKRAIRNRWPSPIESAVILKRPFKERPTTVSRARAFARRAIDYRDRTMVSGSD